MTTSFPALTSSSAPSDRLAVAADPVTEAATLTQLAFDGFVPVRVAVASHGNATGVLLSQLGRDGDVWVREAVAGNPLTPDATVTRLAADIEPSVREVVASRSALPAAAYELLLSDISGMVLRRLAARHDLPATAASRLLVSEPARQVLAANPSVSVSVLAELTARSVAADDKSLWGELLRNPALPFACLAVLYAPVRASARSLLNAQLSNHPVLTSVSPAQVRALMSSGDDLMCSRILMLAQDEQTGFGTYIVDEFSRIHPPLAGLPTALLLTVARHLPDEAVGVVG